MIFWGKSKILTTIIDPFLEKAGVRVFVKREDLVHPLAGGNKFRKLKYNLEKAKTENKTTLVTFGGAYSNHIAATAFAGKEYGFKTIGIIRGEKTEALNFTLKRVVECGMELIFVDRSTYSNKEIALKVALEGRVKKNLFIIPEGASNYEGYKGCREIADEIEIDFNYICCPCGTGTTLAGITSSLKKHQQAIGFSVMKNNLSLEKCVKNFLEQNKASFSISDYSFQIFNDYHFGGYAKSTTVLDDFVKRFTRINQIEIESIYTGKMFFGIYDLIEKNVFKKDDVIIAVHTGGLQYLKEF